MYFNDFKKVAAILEANLPPISFNNDPIPYLTSARCGTYPVLDKNTAFTTIVCSQCDGK